MRQPPSVPGNIVSNFSHVFKASAAAGYDAQRSAATLTVSWGRGCSRCFRPLPEHLYSDIWLHGDTLYPSISLFPPLVLRSLKVTSVWTGPVHFYSRAVQLDTSHISHKHPLPSPAHPTPCTPYSRLIPPPPHPPTLFTAGATDSDSHKLPSPTESSPYWPVQDSLGCRFHFIQIKNFMKHHTNQISIKSGPHVSGCTRGKPCTQAQIH